MAPFGLKLWENAFQMMPDISFFGAEKFVRQKCSTKMFVGNVFVGKSVKRLVWRSYDFLDVMGRCSSKNDPQGFDFQLSTTFFCRVVKDMVSTFPYGF